MIRNIYLIALRAYLSLVGTWGFWIGIISMPVVAIIVFSIAFIAESSTGTRYYVVLEHGKSVVADSIYAEIKDRKNLTPAEQQELIETRIKSLSDPRASTNIQVMENIDIGSANFVEVKSPVNTIEELRPWLNGEKKIRYRQDDVELFAAIVVPHGNGPIEYWSQNVIDDNLAGIVRSALYELARREVFEEKNVPLTVLQDVDEVVRQLEKRRLREEGDEQSSEVTFSDRVPFIAALVLSTLLWITILSTVTSLMMGTIEEKSNRLFDCLLTSVRLPELLSGKMLGVMLLSLTIYTIWTLLFLIPIILGSFIIPGQVLEISSALSDGVLDPALLVPTFLCFILGYIMYGSMFIAVGALCESEQDAQTLISPIIILLMIPLFLISYVIDDPTNPIVSTFAWIPVFTPFLLMVRIPAEASLFEILGQFTLMTATSAAILVGSMQIFKAGAIHGLDVSGVAGWIKSVLKRKR